MLKNNLYHNYVLGLLSLLLLVGLTNCSTRRNTFPARTYHKLTGHYNGYWNALESLKTGERKLEESATDNYHNVLRVYNYGDEKDAVRVRQLLEKAIKKAAVNIQQHSMVFNREEKNPWIARSYFVMGKAYFLEHKWNAARRTFEFIAKNYPYQVVHYRARLWLAKTYIAAKEPEKADAQLNLLQRESKELDFPYKLKRQLTLVLADFFISQHEYSLAYPYLEEALSTCHQAGLCTRLLFIMGQINRKEGHLAEAAAYYKKVIKRNPPFVMDFAARLKLATSYDTNETDLKYAKKILDKMLKNHQYALYKGQVYYALSQLNRKTGDFQAMVKNLKLSVMESKNNKLQRQLSALQLAKYLYSKKKFNSSGAYYDTALMAMNKSNPDYEIIRKKVTVLKEISRYQDVLIREDSLMHLAKMDTAELYALIDKKIALQIAKKKKQKETVGAGSGVNFNRPETITATNRFGLKGWYFYNPQAKAQGYNRFLARWGNRKLEDMWFLKNRTQQSPLSAQRTAENTNGNKVMVSAGQQGKGKVQNNKEIGETSRLYYLKNIPFSPEQKQKAKLLIEKAYEKLGFLYLDAIKDTLSAIENYKQFLTQFPNNPKRLQVWYYLYTLYKNKGNDKASAQYKNLILENYPNTIFAQVIENPDYYKMLQTNKMAAKNLYQRTYNAFEAKQYYRVIDFANRAENRFASDSALMPKFLFLKAVSLGKVETPDSLYYSLKTLIKKYPQSKLVKRANNIIRMLQIQYGIGVTEKERKALLAGQMNVGKGPEYTFDIKAPQQIMIVLNRHKVNSSALLVRLSDFNRKYFQSARLQVSRSIPDGNHTLVLVKTFPDVQVAMLYYKRLRNDNYVFSGIVKNDYQLFIISLKNYPLFYKNKNIELYKQFFNEKYN